MAEYGYDIDKILAYSETEDTGSTTDSGTATYGYDVNTILESNDPELEGSVFGKQVPTTAIGRLGESFKQREQDVADALVSYAKGTADYEQAKFNAVTKGIVGTINDIAGEAVSTLFTTFTTQEARDYLKELIASGTEEVMKTDTAKKLLNLYETLEPEDQATVDGAANSALLSLSRFKMPGTKKITSTLKSSAAKSKIKKREKQVADSVLDQSNNAKGSRNIKDINQLKTDKELLNAFFSVPGVNALKTPGGNVKLIDTELKKLDAKLEKAVRSGKSSNLLFSKKGVKEAIQRDIDALKDPANKGVYDPVFKTSSFKSLFEDFKEIADGWIDTYKAIRPKDILEIRRKFDKSIKKKAKTDDMFKDLGAQGKILRTYRDSLNKLMDDLDTGVDTKSIRTRMSKLYIVRSNIRKNSTNNKTWYKKTAQYAKSHPFMVLAPLAGSGVLYDPTVQKLGALAGASYLGYKGATSPYLRQGAANLLQTAPYLSTTGMLDLAKEEEQ